MSVSTPTPATPTDWAWLAAEVRVAASRFAATLRQLDADAAVPGLDWNVGQLSAHVASFPDFYRGQATRSTPLPPPDDFAQFAFDIMTERNGWPLDQLADDIETSFDAWLDDLGDDGDAPVMAWVPHTARGVGAAALNELLVHRRDLSPLSGETVDITPDQARAVLDGLLPMSAAFVNPKAVGDMDAVVHLSVRGGTDWAITVRNGEVTFVPERPQRADLRVSNEPVSMLLSSLGRIPQWKPALTGKAIAWGRKPWIAMQFLKLFNTP